MIGQSLVSNAIKKQLNPEKTCIFDLLMTTEFEKEDYPRT